MKAEPAICQGCGDPDSLTVKLMFTDKDGRLSPLEFDVQACAFCVNNLDVMIASDYVLKKEVVT